MLPSPCRETKLVELSRSSHELQEQNSDLSSQVKEAMRINARLSESCHSSEDLTGRLGEMEKRLQKALAEKESLQAENKVIKPSRTFRKKWNTIFSPQGSEAGVFVSHVSRRYGRDGSRKGRDHQRPETRRYICGSRDNLFLRTCS